MDSQITIGADVEFEIWWGRNPVPARDVLPSSLLDPNESSTGELRPCFSPYPEQVFSDIKKLITALRETLPGTYSVYAGAGTALPLDGHIYFGGVQPHRVLLEKLYLFISIPLNAKGSRMRAGHYESPQHYHHKPYGFEYRTPCSWLAHPVLTWGVLVIARMLASMDKKELRLLYTTDDLIACSPEGSKQSIREFYRFLEDVTNLESIEVLTAWLGSR